MRWNTRMKGITGGKRQKYAVYFNADFKLLVFQNNMGKPRNLASYGAY